MDPSQPTLPGFSATPQPGESHLLALFETAPAGPKQAEELLRLLRMRLNPLFSRPYLLRNALVSLNFPDPTVIISYLVDTGLLVQDGESSFKLGRWFWWLTPELLLDRVNPPKTTSSSPYPPAPAPTVPGTKRKPNDTALLRYGNFLDDLRARLASGEPVLLRGELVPTRLAKQYKIFGSTGSVLVKHGYVEHSGKFYRKLPALDTLTKEHFMGLVMAYVRSEKKSPKKSPQPAPKPPQYLDYPAPATAVVVAPSPLATTPTLAKPGLGGGIGLPGVAEADEPLVSDVASVLVNARPVEDVVVEPYQPARPDFTSGLVPKDHEYVVFFPENVAYFPSDAVATCYAENSILNDGRKSAIIVKLDPSMKMVKKTVQHGTL